MPESTKINSDQLKDEYALASHNHDSAYAASDHDHDSDYAAAEHSHDLAYAASGHDHSGVYEPVISTKGTAFNKNFGTGATDVCQGDDARLTDARTPTTHGNDKHSVTYITGTTRFLNVVIDGGGEAIDTGIKCDVVMPACTIVGAYLLADQSGSIKVDLWKDSYANFPPTNDDSICGGNEPEISSATKDSDTTLTDWTTSVSDGDIIRVNVDSCTTIERCTLSLKITT